VDSIEKPGLSDGTGTSCSTWICLNPELDVAGVIELVEDGDAAAGDADRPDSWRYHTDGKDEADGKVGACGVVGERWMFSAVGNSCA